GDSLIGFGAGEKDQTAKFIISLAAIAAAVTPSMAALAQPGKDFSPTVARLREYIKEHKELRDYVHTIEQAIDTARRNIATSGSNLALLQELKALETELQAATARLN